VQLDEIDGVDAEVLARALEPGAKVRLRIALEDLRRTAAELGRDDERLVTLTQQPREQALGTAVPVDVGGVEEGDTRVDRGVQRRERLRIVGLAPRAADRPGPEADLGDLATGLPESPRTHGLSP
jgi:hypothetical protein